jgi:DNA-binding NarL/FixJ family response regulator
MPNPYATLPDADETLAVNALNRRQWTIYHFARQGYTTQTIAQLVGHTLETTRHELVTALERIAAALETSDEGPPNTHITTTRRWQGNDTAHLPDTTLQQAIRRQERNPRR